MVRRLVIAAAGIVSFPIAAAAAQNPQPAVVGQPTTYVEAIARTRRLIRDTMASLGAPGASMTVMKNGRVIWSEGFGYADLEQQVPVTTLTRFRIGSVSKSMTGVAVGLLVQEGKLDLDAPIQRYVPSFPTKRWPITARQLAGHLSGIRHYRGDEFLNMRHYGSMLAGLAIFQNDTLLFEPGTTVSYSSYGYNLLGLVVAGAAGEPYLAYMQEHVFDPAGMSHTVAEHPDSLIPFRAHFYTVRDSGGGIVNAPYVDASHKWASGGILSTTEDLARFGQAMLDDILVSPETRRLIWAPVTTTDGKATGYGLGWGTSRDDAGRLRVSHGGGSVGGTAYLIVYPEQRLIVALLVNSDHSFVGATPQIARWFLEP